MNKAIILALLALALLLPTAAAAWANVTVDVNAFYDSQSATISGSTEDGVFCAPDDGNLAISISSTLYRPQTGVHVLWRFSDGTVTAATTIGTVGGLTGVGGSVTADGNAATDLNSDAFLTVAVPTAEGTYELCVYDSNSADANFDCEFVQVKPDSTYTKYTISNADADNNGFCKISSYAAAYPNFQESAGKAEINVQSSTDISADIDFDAGIVIEDRKFKMSLTALENKKIKVTLKKANVRGGRFEVLKNGSPCSDILCKNISSGTAGSAVWTMLATPIATFTIEETKTLGITPGMIDDLAAGEAKEKAVIPTEIEVGGKSISTATAGLAIAVTAIVIMVGLAILKAKKKI